MKYAVIKLSGKQHKVSLGDKITVDRLENEPGKSFAIKDVLLVVDGNKRSIGTPLTGDTVTAEVLEQKKDKKIRVATYKAKSRYRRVKGHRQHISVVRITAIGKDKYSSKKAKGKASSPKTKPKSTESKEKPTKK